MAPSSRSATIVGSAARIRVSSATTAGMSGGVSIGTLKSTRTSTRLPFASSAAMVRLLNRYAVAAAGCFVRSFEATNAVISASRQA